MREALERLREISASWKHHECIECATEVIAIAQTEHDYTAEVDALRVRAQALEKTDHFAEAMIDVHRAEEVSRAHNFLLGEAKMLALRASFLSDRGSYAEALELHRKSYEIKKNLDDPLSLAYTMGAIGYCYARMLDLEKAVASYEESIALRQAEGDEWGVAVTFHGLGLAYYYSAHYEQALEYTQKSLALKQRFPDRENSIAMTQHSLATCYFHLGDYEASLKYLLPSIEIKERHGDVISLSLAYNLIAFLQHRRGEVEQGLISARKALDFAEHHGLKQHCRDLHDHFAEVYESIGELSMALHHLRTSHQIDLEMQVEEGRLRFAQISAELQLTQAQHNAEMERMRAARLQENLEAKNRELSAMALSVSQNNQMLQKLRKQLDEMMQQGKDEASIVATMERSINGALRSNNGWQNFEEKFRATHGDFTIMLAARYPALSPVELRVCALLLLHMSSKEIASILSVTAKSVEVYRTRIRQKMKLSNETNLISWLSALKNTGGFATGQSPHTSSHVH